MTNTQIVFIATGWLILWIFCWYKQVKIDGFTKDTGWEVFGAVIILLFSPLFFVGAIIRQVIVEKWK